MTSPEVSIDENGNCWILPNIDNLKISSYSHNDLSSNINNLPSVLPDIDKNADNADNYNGILPNTILGFRPDMRTPSYSHNDLSSNINNLPSVFNDIDKNAIIADKYIGDLPKIDEKSIAGINDSINDSIDESNNENIRSNSLLKTMETKRLITFAKYGSLNKKARPKYSGMTLKQANYHNQLIDILLDNGLYEKIYQKSFTDGVSGCFDNLDGDEIDLMTKFEYIEPELLHTCYIDTSTPDNP
jgi:hypothetical protein